ncbi:MAG TPA: hypothetical protein VFO78_01225 [Candidatus Limnocylindrales bacterium]|nr:hypothetical protein [Candidatus Limnocylindrales bacterium]
MRRTRDLRIALLALALAFAAGSQAPVTLAASPSPAGPSAAPGEAYPDIEAWLDADLGGPDVRPGDVVVAGITLWNRRTRGFEQAGGVYVLLRPAEGDTDPSVGRTRVDFPGHIVAELVVPEGGPGAVETGVRALVCDRDGACANENLAFTTAGTGPPPDADPTALVGATFQPFDEDIVAGREFPVVVDVFPRGRWEPGAVPRPEHVVVTATRRGGLDVAAAELRPGGPGSPYAGRMAIPETGSVTLAITVPSAAGGERPIAGATTVVTVLEAGPLSAQPVDQGAGGDIPFVVWLVGFGALLAGGLLARRALADL